MACRYVRRISAFTKPEPSSFLGPQPACRQSDPARSQRWRQDDYPGSGP